ncbi:MAG: TraB/GumN family protein [Caulobacteraceae bacterium]|nr:TraB/GumN family protein [Caulobacteraceae bacterium]
MRHARRPSPVRPLAWLAGLCAVFLAGSAVADPALWEVKGPHAKVYLFGTIHVLRPSQPWRSAAVDKALAESQTLWLEIPDSNDLGAARSYIQQLGIDAEHPLSTKLTPADLARVDAAAKALGAPGEARLEPMRPWLAAITLSVLPALKAGYDPKSGVEQALTRQATAEGKPIKGFETLGEQLHFLADLPQDQEVALLDSTLDDISDAAAKTDEMVHAWAAGDVEKLARLTDEHMKRDSPALYDLLLTQRNRNWAATLDERLQGEGVSFVAVGAGHLAGPDSLQHDLEARGYRVVRIH